MAPGECTHRQLWENRGTRSRLLPPSTSSLHREALVKRAGVSAACGTCSKADSGPFSPFPWNVQWPVSTPFIMALVLWKGTDLTVPWPLSHPGPKKRPQGRSGARRSSTTQPLLLLQTRPRPNATLAILSGRPWSSPPRITSLLPRDEPKEPPSASSPLRAVPASSARIRPSFTGIPLGRSLRPWQVLLFIFTCPAISEILIYGMGE